MSDEIIYVKLNLFTFNQVIYVQDNLGTKNTSHIPTDDVARYVCSLAKERKIHQVKIVGPVEFSLAAKDEIDNYQKINYSNDFLNVEVIKEND